MTDQLKPLSDKDRAILLTRLGMKNIKGLRKWRERLNIQPPQNPAKPRKPRTPPAYPRYGNMVQCVETGKVYPSYNAVVREFGKGHQALKAHLMGINPDYCGYTFKHWT